VNVVSVILPLKIKDVLIDVFSKRDKTNVFSKKDKTNENFLTFSLNYLY